MTDNNDKAKKVDLSSLRANRRKRGRTSEVSSELLEAIAGLNSGEGWQYEEATLYTPTYKKEESVALPIIMREKDCDKDEAQAIFENRWISRYRQRAVAGWKLAELPDKEYEFVVMNDGRVFVGRK
jgi:hypothetical protein